MPQEPLHYKKTIATLNENIRRAEEDLARVDTLPDLDLLFAPREQRLAAAEARLQGLKQLRHDLEVERARRRKGT